MAHKIKDENGNVLKVDGKEVWAIDFGLEVKQPDKDKGKRVIGMVGSTPNIDRDNDIIVQSGWDLKSFRKSSPVLWCHDHKIPAIAKVNKLNKTKDSLVFEEIEFPKEGIHRLADMVYELILGKFIKAGSVGFLPIKSERRERTEDEEKNEPESFCPPTKFLKQELLEFSICNVGSNRDALVTHLGAKGFQTSGKIKVPVPGSVDNEEIEVDVMEFLGKLLTPGEDKKVIPYKKYPLEPEDASWDGPKQVRDSETTALRTISTWFDADKPDIKSSYKLPHHLASNKNTVWRGVRAAMGTLLGARGGVNIPENEKAGTHKHLANHYRDFGKDVPELKEYTESELKEIFQDLFEEKTTEKFILNDSAVGILLRDIDSLDTVILMYVNFLMESGEIIKDVKVIKAGEGLTGYFEEEIDQTKIVSVELSGRNIHSDEQKTPDAEILRLKDGSFLLDFKPAKSGNYRIQWGSKEGSRCLEADLQELVEGDGTTKNESFWRTIQRITIQDIEQKAGAVLNKTNKKRLKDAQQLIGEVLSESEPAEPEDKNEPDKKNTEPPEKLKEVLEAVKTLTGKIADIEKRLSKNDTVVINVANKQEPTDGDDKKGKDDIDLDSITLPEKEKGIDLDEVRKILKNDLPITLKSLIDKKFDKALGKV